MVTQVANCRTRKPKGDANDDQRRATREGNFRELLEFLRAKGPYTLSLVNLIEEVVDWSWRMIGAGGFESMLEDARNEFSPRIYRCLDVIVQRSHRFTPEQQATVLHLIADVVTNLEMLESRWSASPLRWSPKFDQAEARTLRALRALSLHWLSCRPTPVLIPAAEAKKRFYRSTSAFRAAKNRNLLTEYRRPGGRYLLYDLNELTDYFGSTDDQTSAHKRTSC